MALSDCIEWGNEFKNKSKEYKETMTKSINGFSIEELFNWLSEKDYLSDDPEIIKKEMFDDLGRNNT